MSSLCTDQHKFHQFTLVTNSFSLRNHSTKLTSHQENSSLVAPPPWIPWATCLWILQDLKKPFSRSTFLTITHMMMTMMWILTQLTSFVCMSLRFADALVAGATIGLTARSPTQGRKLAGGTEEGTITPALFALSFAAVGAQEETTIRKLLAGLLLTIDRLAAMPTAAILAVTVVLGFFILFPGVKSVGDLAGVSKTCGSGSVTSLCSHLIEPSGYPCSEHSTKTEDGYMLGLQRVSSGIEKLRGHRGPPVLLQHGLFMGGDAWFLDSTDQSLGFVLADQGFDVWVGNVRGTHWSHGHVSLSVGDKDFWDWSWQELALFDLAEMIRYVNAITNSSVFVVGHSQGTIMSLAAFTQPEIVNMVAAAALLCPISYLDHITSPFVRDIVLMHLDAIMIDLGVHQLNFKSDFGTSMMDMVCDSRVDCSDLLASITGKNCCFNDSRVDFYLDNEPHPSSAKNLRHLFQMIRKGTFAKYDYGMFKNLKLYGQLKPPKFDLSHIPASLPIWMGYGGNDALADVEDVKRTIKELKSKPDLLYMENYGHIDFLLSIYAKRDVYDNMISFFRSVGNYGGISS